MVIRSPLMKVMIVDDELLAIEDLQTLIPWDQYGFDIVATATNGKKALELFERLKPNLIILDVKMPIMDGIELLKELQDSLHQKQVIVILLTAYKDFEYAKKAIEFRVSNYLLKHTIDETSLLNEVLKAKSEWLLHLEQKRMLLSKMIIDFIEGNGAEERESAIRLPFSFNTIGFIMLEEDRPYPLFHDETPTALYKNSIGETVRSIGTQIQPPIVHIEVIDSYGGGCALVVFFDGLYSRKVVQELLYRLAANCLDYYRQVYPTTLSSIIAFTEQLDARSIQTIYKELKQAIKYKWFVGKNQIIDYYSIRNHISHLEDEQANPIGGPLESYLNELNEINDINEMELDEMKSRISTLFRELKQAPWNLSALRSVINGLINALRKHDDLYELFSLIKTIHWYEIRDIENGLISMYEQYYHKKMTSKNDGLSYKTIQAIDYIRKHYMDDLNVSNVSRAINISPSYLHQLFKSEIKKTFLEFLTEYRIQVAKKLLENSDYKIYEIAELTGYNTSQYFSQVFQKVTGMTPHAYKKKATRQTIREYQLQNIISL